MRQRAPEAANRRPRGNAPARSAGGNRPASPRPEIFLKNSLKKVDRNQNDFYILQNVKYILAL